MDRFWEIITDDAIEDPDQVVETLYDLLIRGLITALDIRAAREKFMRDVLKSEIMGYATKKMLVELLEVIFKSLQRQLGRHQTTSSDDRQRELRDVSMELHAFRGDLTRFEYEEKRMSEIRKLQGILQQMTRQLDELTLQYKTQQARVDALRKEYVARSQVPPYGDPALHAQHMSALAAAQKLFAQGKALYGERKKVEAEYRKLVLE
jgi:YesN/AraC family two-component response regulator